MKYILFFLSLIVLFIFILTAPPTIYLGDGGEIASACYNLGIGHPPGYPLFLLIGKIASYIPLADVAFRINLISILLSICVFLILYLCVKEFLLIFNKNNILVEIISLITSFVFIFSDDFFSIASNVKGGIYVFNIFVLLLTIFSSIRYYFYNNKKYLYFTFYCAGFLPVAHQTSLFIMFLLLFAILFVAYKRREKNIFIVFFFFFFTFITSWFYLFIRYKVAMNVWAGIDSFGLLLEFITRKVYLNQNMPVFTISAGVSKFLWYLKNFFENFNLLFLFVFYGFIILYKKLRWFFWFNFFAFIINLFLIIYFTYNGNSPEFFYVNTPFYIVNNLFSMFYVSIGIFAFIQILKNKFRINQYLIIFLFFFISLIILLNGFNKNNHSRRFLAYDHAINIFNTVNNKDKIFGQADIYIFNIQYIKQVKKKYLEIDVYDQSGNVLDISIYKPARKKGILDMKMREYVELQIYFNNKENIYFMDMTSYPEHLLLTRPYGILHKLTENNVYIKNTDKLMQLYSLRDLFNCKNNDYFYRYVLGRYLVRKAEYAAMNLKLNEFEYYKNYCEQLAGDVPNIIKNIASIYFHNLKDLKNTMKYLEKSMEIDSYDFAALNLIIALYHEMGMKEKERYWLKFYYEKEWRPEIKKSLLRRLQYLNSQIQG